MPGLDEAGAVWCGPSGSVGPSSGRCGVLGSGELRQAKVGYVVFTSGRYVAMPSGGSPSGGPLLFSYQHGRQVLILLQPTSKAGVSPLHLTRIISTRERSRTSKMTRLRRPALVHLSFAGLDRVAGVEPAFTTSEAAALPLGYTRMVPHSGFEPELPS